MIKYPFYREDGRYTVKRINSKSDREVISLFDFQNGRVEIVHNNYHATIYNVDSIVIKYKPLDEKGVTELSFDICNENNAKPSKLPIKFYGVLSEHFIIDHTAENSDIPKYNVEEKKTDE